MMRVPDSTFLKFITGGWMVFLLFSFDACKPSVAEKNTELVQQAMPDMQAQKDSLKIEYQQVKEEYEVLKSKAAQVPAATLNQPQYARLAETLEGISRKSERMNGGVSTIEAKLEELTRSNKEKPLEALQQEIAAVKEMLQLHRGKMNNYMENYKKLESQLDSIQKRQK